MLPKELLEKYHIDTLENEKIVWGKDAEVNWYRTFLSRTDHIPIKIIEGLMEELASATLLNFIEVFLKFIISVRTEYKEVLQYRKYAREKINELEQSTTP